VLLDRRTFWAGGVLSLTTGLAAGQARAAGVPELREREPRALPDLAFLDAEGRERRLAEWRGRGVVINFWATWCPPCVAEMPALDRLAEQVAREGIEVLALSSDRGGRAQVEPFYQRVGLRNLAIWLDPRGAFGRAAGVRGLPTTVIVDRAGMERTRHEGAADWDHPTLVGTIRRLTRSAEAATRGA
jgi:thiol-disulfide isomerase/thioredoxin